VFSSRVARVVIAASDDSGRFHTAIGRALNSWNTRNAQRHQIVLLHSSESSFAPDTEDPDDSPGPGGRPHHYDVLVALFDPTPRAVVDVMADVARARAADKLVLAWLIAESPSRRAIADDQAWLGDVTRRLAQLGVSPNFIGHPDAQLESRLHGAITADLTDSTLRQLTRQYEANASARQITTHRTPVTLLGPQIWAVTVMNSGTSLAVGLTVSVDAVDANGNDVPDGARRSRQPIAEVFARLRTEPWPDAYRPPVDPAHVTSTGPQVFPTTAMNVVAAHTALDFPRWLRPNQRASALYAVDPNASLRVRIRFEDETGEVWSRTNDAAPVRVSSATPLRSDAHVS
jgi:hypothetical protein